MLFLFAKVGGNRLKNRVEELQKERSLIHGTENRYGIYQLSDGRGSEYRFMGLDFVNSRGLQVKVQLINVNR